MKDNYDINIDTCAIIPLNKQKTVIIERENDYKINKSSLIIMDEGCKYFGSSLEGRKEGTKKILGINYKVPIIIEETNELIFFPTETSKSEKCIWLSLKNIEYYQRYNGKVLITFKNGKKIIIKISYGSFENQIFRATRLMMKIKDRKNIKNSY